MRLTALSLASFVLAACATTTTPRIRVAADLGCTAEETRVEKIPEPPPRPNLARWQVTGCGRTAVYLCTTPVRDCWREGEIRADSSP